jgi:hypothetical protein
LLEPWSTPAAGLEHDPLLPPRPADEPAYRLAREPRTVEERAVAQLLSLPAGGRRGALLERLADELRRAQGDPLAGAPDVGLYRQELYQDEAAELLDRLVGDLLAEAPRPE